MRALALTIVAYLIAPIVSLSQPKTQAIEPENLTQEQPITVVEQPAPQPEPQATQSWESNPQHCTDNQWIAAEPPFDCIDKPVEMPTIPSAPANCESYRSLVSQYDWDVETMMYAMSKESGCNPGAVGDLRTINGVYAPSCGLLQIRTLPGRPSCDQLKDPATNIATAYIIWSNQGYQAWTVLH